MTRVLDRRAFLATLASGVLPATRVAVAQETQKVARVGMLAGSSGPLVDAFRQGLRERGYVEGRNLTLEYRFIEGTLERVPAMVAELVRLKVDVIVASSQAAIAAKQATSVIPIVMPVSTDPVRLGLVVSLAKPGGNVTGLATQNDELPGKWLELIKEAVPSASRVAMLVQPSYDGGVQVKAAEAAARSLAVGLRTLSVEGPDDLTTTLANLGESRPDALIVSSSALFYLHRARLVQFAAKQRLPAIYHQSEFVIVTGGLMSYGPDFRDMHRRAAGYVDKILKGARPADLPIEQPTKFELVVNLRAAKALGLTPPRSLLGRADRVLE